MALGLGGQGRDSARFHFVKCLTSTAGRWLKRLAPLPAALLLAGCNGYSVLNPAGQIGAGELWTMIFATLLMLIVVVPVIGMALFFAWKYRESNTEAEYAPEWSHSTKIEVVVWLVPCLIILALGAVTWFTSHSLDPYKPIASDEKPIHVQVVSLDWKWLFIYPEYGIATVNELRIPKDVPVEFSLTSGSVMNAFFIPRLGGMIYTMAGMQTKLHLIADRTGEFDGASANYSGGGFSDMKFVTYSMDKAGFEAWTDKVKQSANPLTLATYAKLAQPGEDHAPTYYSEVAPNLFDSILHKLFVSGTFACAAPQGAIAVAKE